MTAARPEIITSRDEDFLLQLERWLPERHVLPLSFRDVAQRVQDLPVKDNDIWIVTFPKSVNYVPIFKRIRHLGCAYVPCELVSSQSSKLIYFTNVKGTTWMQETVWLLVNNLDFETALQKKLIDRAPFLESPLMKNLGKLDHDSLEAMLTKIANLPGRRVVKSHLHWDKLPSALRQPKTTTKIVYVARHPKDVCISYFYFNRILSTPEHKELSRDLETYGEKFVQDLILYSPYWTHVFDFWNRRTEPNICFVWYEEMKENLSGVIMRLCDFLEVPEPSKEGMERLLDHLSFKSMKNNPAVNFEGILDFQQGKDDAENAAFIRKGAVGQWKEKMSLALVQKFDEWIKQNTADTDFHFYR